MSTWIEGRQYSFRGGAPILCARRFFDGALEMVELHHSGGMIDVRTALAAAVPMITPHVTETLGGVTRGDLCDHRWYGRIVANAGPFVGRVCCTACGCPPDEPLDSPAMRAVTEAVERRVREGMSHVPLCTHLDLGVSSRGSSRGSGARHGTGSPGSFERARRFERPTFSLGSILPTDQRPENVGNVGDPVEREPGKVTEDDRT